MAKTKEVKTIDDLRGASYNPRTITDKQLKHLEQSMDKFGDLSGIVFNVNSGVLVSGHQRSKAIKGKKTKIIKTKQKRDRQGTVAIGHVEVYEADGTTTKIPYREVDWGDKLTEMAANVAANMAGGEFDQVKLGAVMHKLEQGKFEVEMTGIDNWDLQKAIGKFKKSKESDEGQSGGGGESGEEGTEEFEAFDPTKLQFDACCPKCKFKFNLKNAGAKPPKEKKEPIIGRPEKKKKKPTTAKSDKPKAAKTKPKAKAEKKKGKK